MLECRPQQARSSPPPSPGPSELPERRELPAPTTEHERYIPPGRLQLAALPTAALPLQAQPRCTATSRLHPLSLTTPPPKNCPGAQASAPAARRCWAGLLGGVLLADALTPDFMGGDASIVDEYRGGGGWGGGIW